MSGIAISYRRSDSSAIAGRIFDRLALRYGKQSVFMDIENIPFGIDFRTHINDVLQKADLLIVLIGRQWAGARAGGGARIHEQADPVRHEVEVAFERKLPLIPVLVEGAVMPGKADLPDTLERLAYLNAAEVASGRDFNPHMDRLIAAIDAVLPAPLGQPALPVEAAEAAPAVSGSEPPVSRAGSWRNEFLLYLIVPLAALLVAHHLIVNSFDLNPDYLRAISFVVPFLSGFLLSWQSGRGFGIAFAFAVALGLLGDAGMATSEGLNSGQPIMPETRAEWRENIEYVVEIAVALMAGNVAAAGLRGLLRKKLPAATRG